MGLESQEQGSIVAVSGNGLAEGEGTQRLQLVVDLEESVLAFGPEGVARGGGCEADRVEREVVVAATLHDVAREIAAREHHEVGSSLVAQGQAIPLCCSRQR